MFLCVCRILIGIHNIIVSYVFCVSKRDLTAHTISLSRHANMKISALVFFLSFVIVLVPHWRYAFVNRYIDI